jgi:hypothetical protein
MRNGLRSKTNLLVVTAVIAGTLPYRRFIYPTSKFAVLVSIERIQSKSNLHVSYFLKNFFFFSNKMLPQFIIMYFSYLFFFFLKKKKKRSVIQFAIIVVERIGLAASFLFYFILEGSRLEVGLCLFY